MNALISSMLLLLCLARNPELDSSLGPLGCRNKGHVIWPSPGDGVARLTPAQLSMLLEGIDWRAPLRTWRPEVAG
jgi:hypothetical protein